VSIFEVADTVAASTVLEEELPPVVAGVVPAVVPSVLPEVLDAVLVAPAAWFPEVLAVSVPQAHKAPDNIRATIMVRAFFLIVVPPFVYPRFGALSCFLQRSFQVYAHNLIEETETILKNKIIFAENEKMFCRNRP
jgi:hypothetical protein